MVVSSPTAKPSKMEWKERAAMVTKSRTEIEQSRDPMLKQQDFLEPAFFLSGGW